MICKTCGKEFTEKYSKWCSGDFCSRSCSNKYSRKHIDIKKQKIVKCIKCKKEISVSIVASDKQCMCYDCKKYKTYISENGKKCTKIIKQKCNVCGEYKCQRKDICKKFKLFSSLIKWFGLDKSKIGTIYFYEEFEKSVNLMKEEYFDNKLSLKEIGKKYNCNFQTLSEMFKSLNIKLRTLSESVNNAILQGKPRGNCVNQYKCGWHTTWNNKTVFYRSSYELDYAKELDKKKINYEVEKLRILYWDSRKQIQRIAIPDFYLPETNELVEIKSTWTYDEINMKDKFKAYKEHGYTTKLILEHKENAVII